MAVDNMLGRKLAPAPDRASVLVAPAKKSKLNNNNNNNYNHLYSGPQPASVARRNARERNRVKQVNNGFATLRQHIPQTVSAAVTGNGRGASKKLSKVDTLKLAVEYIRSLQQLLDDHDPDSEAGSSYDARSYYPESPDSLGTTIGGHHTPPSSEASVSPSPSFTSENYVPVPKYNYPVDSYENYDPMSPEDEELLDAITWWQQQ